eukprot:gene12152-biopygen18456
MSFWGSAGIFEEDIRSTCLPGALRARLCTAALSPPSRGQVPTSAAPPPPVFKAGIAIQLNSSAVHSTSKGNCPPSGGAAPQAIVCACCSRQMRCRPEPSGNKSLSVRRHKIRIQTYVARAWRGHGAGVARAWLVTPGGRSTARGWSGIGIRAPWCARAVNPRGSDASKGRRGTQGGTTHRQGWGGIGIRAQWCTRAVNPRGS